MKKLICLMAVLGILFLAACSNNQTSGKGGAESKDSDPSPKKVTYEDYRDELQTRMDILSYGFEDLTATLKEEQDDSSLIYDKKWEEAVENDSTDLYSTILEIKSLEPGDSPEAVKVHEMVMKSMNEYEFMVKNLPDAVRSSDIDLLKICWVHSVQGDYFFNQTKNLLKAQ